MVDLNIKIVSDKSYVFIGVTKRIKFCVTVANIGDERANYVEIPDFMIKGARVIPETLCINMCREHEMKYNNGIIIQSICPGENIFISYEVEIDEKCIQNNVINMVIASYCDDNGNNYISESNQLIIPIIYINVCVNKAVDKCLGKVGDILNYTILIRNKSNIDIINSVLYDVLSPDLNLVPWSVFIQGESQDVRSLNNGLNIGTISSKSNKVITFQTEVTTLPISSSIKNIAKLEYDYTVQDNGTTVTSIGESVSNCMVTKILK